MNVVNPYRFAKSKSILSLTTDQSTLSDVSITVSISGNKKYTVDWGDGSEVVELESYDAISHSYSDNGIYDINVYEDTAIADEMIQFSCYSSNLIGTIDFSKLINLQKCVICYNSLSNFILGDNSVIAGLDIRGNNFSGELDLSQYTSLTWIYLDYCDYDSVILDGLFLLTRYLEYTSVGNRIGDNLANFSCVGCTSLTVINFDGQILNNLDVTGCTSLNTFKLSNTDTTDDNLIGIEDIESIETLWLCSIGITIFPSFSQAALQTFTTIGYEGSGITTIDLSDCDNLKYFGNTNYSYTKRYLESVTFPRTTSNLLRINISNCYINGAINVTAYSNLTNFEFEKNTGITSVNCSGLGSVTIGESKYLRGLDSVTSLNFSDTSFNFNNQKNPMPELIEIDVTNCPLTRIQLTNSSLPASQVNKILVEADTAGAEDGTVYIVGDAAAPDSSSGGYDGITAIANLEAKGWTVTVNAA